MAYFIDMAMLVTPNLSSFQQQNETTTPIFSNTISTGYNLSKMVTSAYSDVSSTGYQVSEYITDAHSGAFSTAYVTSDVTTAGYKLNETDVSVDDVFSPFSNPGNIISFQTTQTIRFACQVYVFPVILVLGVISNILNCIVFFKQDLKERMNLCLFWMAVVDLMYVCCQATVAAASFLLLAAPELHEEYYVKRSMYVGGVVGALMATSGCISMVIAVERCLCVVFPLKAQTLMSTTSMAVILGTTTVLLQLGFASTPVSLQAVSFVENGQTRWLLTSAQIPHIDVVFMVTVVMYSLPFVFSWVVIICTVITVVKLKLALSWRKSSSGSSHLSEASTQQTALTKMLVVGSCVYIACSIPACALSLWDLTDTRFSTSGQFANLFWALNTIVYNFIWPLNSSVSFFVYYSRSSKFRSVLQSLCCAGKKKIVDPTISTITKTQASF